MADDRAQEIARLEAEIAKFQQGLEMFGAIPAMRESFTAQLEQCRRQLALLQTGGTNLGVGDIIGRDKLQIERVVQIVQQIVVGEVASVQLEQIRRLIAPQPGAE